LALSKIEETHTIQLNMIYAIPATLF